ncbi:MAG: type II toxin-antitoxin system Phd/YefM family antitoxin [Rhodospirillales bacterium]|nr:type II toxin-antitoxin system Phd/YefM family antitoxin [Rhodospirillales bacterium]MYE19076.1 type II toxin-antitoxin system Phd/YefM family antitoxin [Rhodospirillales bacterium]
MTRTWQVQTAKAHFSAFLEASRTQGPRLVTECGVPAAVFVPFQQWRKTKLLTK